MNTERIFLETLDKENKQEILENICAFKGWDSTRKNSRYVGEKAKSLNRTNKTILAEWHKDLARSQYHQLLDGTIGE